MIIKERCQGGEDVSLVPLTLDKTLCPPSQHYFPKQFGREMSLLADIFVL